MATTYPSAAVFCAPARYTQGPGASMLLAKEMQVLGPEDPFLVTTAHSPEKALPTTGRTSFKEQA